MTFEVKEAIELLERTPNTLDVMLKGLSEQWIHCNEGEETWSAFDVVGHLIDGERNDWIKRVEIICSNDALKEFKPFDRFEHLERNRHRSLEELLVEFNQLRKENLAQLKSKMSEFNLDWTGVHPAFGQVTLRQLLSTWVVHDLNHISQIARVMAHRYKHDVGPWQAYLRVLK
ncbi:DinB family protein [Pseudalkalibacillus berkeleyi]|uniref:DinB family protein n=1 Tax=Pseudalkalibacillus berkeleyi TaxID=1069813 RepID=A0ABS9H0N3_9BACL|nr:DinB family protein [Pseudalkalibacillus berkeleyi]MCF6137403.1 DinB family protein [Pseudalkalibacillus berkeleyi]